MRSEGRLGVALAAVLLAWGCGGCGIKLGARPQNQDSLEIGGQTACLSGAADTIGDYLHGQATQGEIGGLWDCAKSSLSLFENDTQGQTPGQWSPGELKKFLERYFLKDFRISDGLMTQIMLLKQTLLGGSADALTRADLDRAQALMVELKTVSLSIEPYISQLNPDGISSLSRSDLETAIGALQSGASNLGLILQENASPYAFSNFDQLLLEIENFMSDSKYQSSIDSLRQNLPIFQQVKKILVSSGAESDAVQMTGADWRNLLTTGAKAYSIYLRYLFASKNDPSFTWGQGLDDSFRISSDTKVLMDEILVRNGGQISFKNVDELIDTPNIPGLVGTDPDGIKYFSIMGDRVCRQHLKDVMRVVVRRFMTEPVGTPASAASAAEMKPIVVPDPGCVYPGAPTTDTDGFRKENLDRFWDYFLGFLNGQRYLEAAFKVTSQNVTGDASNFNTGSFAPSSLAAPTLDDLFSSDILGRSPSLVEAGNRLRGYLQETDLFPLFRKDEYRIAFNGYKGDRSQSLWNLTLVNGVGSLVRFVLSSYIPHELVGAPGSPEDKAQREKELAQGASKQAIETFYADTKDIGIDVKLYDPTSPNAADKRQLEASLFTFHSVGGEYMPMEEGTDYVSTLLSSKLLSAQTYDRIVSSCRGDGINQCMKTCTLGSTSACQAQCEDHNPVLGPIDVFGNPSISVACFRQKFFGDFTADIWQDHMPALYAYYTSLPERPAQNPQGAGKLDPTVYRETVGCFMDQVARSYEEGSDWYDSGDVDELSALSHYVEALFTRFDQNGDSFIDFDEGMKIFPMLDPLLIEAQETAPAGSPMRSLTSEYRRLGALTYMLKTGEIPSTVDFIWWAAEDYADFNDWFNNQNHDAWHYEADRGRVLQIMGLISSMENSTNGNVVLDTSACFRW